MRLAPVLAALASLASLAPGAAAAHDAFGDMGPFYASLLHPLADPAQGVILAGAAVLLARQPLATVRSGYAALALCGAGVAALATLGVAPGVPPVAPAALACLLGLGAVAGVALPRAVAGGLLGATGLVAGLAFAEATGPRDAALGLSGAAAGVALAPLLLWGLADLAVRRIGPVAGAVIGSWVAAVGIMIAALGA